MKPSFNAPRVSMPALIWIGVVIAAAGFVLIAIAWGQMAAETQVYLQLPYLVSAGLTGLGLIMVGVTVVNVAARQRDAHERERQMDRLASILEQVEASLDKGGPKGRRPAGARDGKPGPAAWCAACRGRQRSGSTNANG